MNAGLVCALLGLAIAVALCFMAHAARASRDDAELVAERVGTTLEKSEGDRAGAAASEADAGESSRLSYHWSMFV